MSQRGRRLLWGLIAVGVLGRLVWGVTTYGQPFDVRSAQIVHDFLVDHGLDLYGAVNGTEGELFRWPYPPGFLPFFLLSDWLADVTRIDYHDIVQLPSIAADAGIAWLLQWFLGRRGASERIRLGAVAAVMLGPAFAVISGYHTQIDSLAILPALAGVLLWVERPEDRRRWLWAGLLIGVGAAIKTTPAVVILALLPTARSAREGAATLATAAVVPAAAFLPFFVSDPDGVRHVFDYTGVPGAGGLTMILDPGILPFWLTEIWTDTPVTYDPNGVVQALTDASGPLTAVVFAAIGAFLLWARADAITGAVLIWLGMYVFGTAFFFQYFVWGLPFFLAAGHLRKAIALQVALVVPMLLFYSGPRGDGTAEAAYFAVMAAIWLAALVAFAVTARRIALTRRAAASAAA